MNYKPAQREEKNINGNIFNSKVKLDKYYTPLDLAKYCIDKTYEIIGRENISEIVEPSAGNGSFSSQIQGCIAYDIEPEGDDIIKQDYLELELDYKKGRLVIGNPPYGNKNNMALKFYKKSVQICDFISFILPLNQYDNNVNYYEFDLIYSEKLENVKFDKLDSRVNLCFNIYKRREDGLLNTKRLYKFKDFSLYEQVLNSKNPKRNKPYKDNCYDFRICSWGQKCGKILNENQSYTKEIAFYIHNKDIKEKIYNLILNINMKEDFNVTSTPNLVLWQVYEYILKNIPEIQ